MENKPILSPFIKKQREVTAEDLQAVRKLLGVECVLLMIDQDAAKNCTPETCQGHLISGGSVGFTKEQIYGIGKILAEQGEDFIKE
jgi:hypothetical protein